MPAGRSVVIEKSPQSAEGDLEITKKPTRKDLLKVVTELQRLIGRGMACHGNDRDPHGFEKGNNALQEAHNLCIAARSFDPPADML